MIRFDFHKFKYGKELLIDCFSISEIAQRSLALKEIHTTSFYEMFFFRNIKGEIALEDSRLQLHGPIALLLPPGQPRKWNLNESPDGMVVIFEREFLETFLRDNYFLHRLYYFGNYDAPPVLNLTSDKIADLLDLLKSIKHEINLLSVDSFHLLRAYLYQLLILVNRSYGPDLVVFPELSIPVGILPLLEEYSRENKMIIVAGSHYEEIDGKRISVCPIFISGERHDIHKLQPSPFERSMFESDGLQPGLSNTVFINTPVGNFVTLICADFLDDEILTYVTSEFNLDFLIIPSCQKDSNRYFTRLSEKVKDSKEGLYGLFPNLFIPSESEGRSGIMGSVDNIYINSAITKKITDARPETKLWEASSDNDFVIAEFNLKQKKPFKVKSHEAEPNVKILRTRAHIPKTRADYTSKRNKYRIVGFDMDGTIIRNLKFSWVKLWEHAGDVQGKLWKGYLRDYRINKIDYATWCKEAVSYFRTNGIKKSDIISIANQCSLTENFQSGIKRLKDAGFVVGIISGGIDTFHHTLIPNHKEIFDFEYINKLLFSTDDELLSVESTEYDFDYKFDAIELECDERGFSINEAIFIGDQFNDDTILKKVGHSIVYSSNDDPVGLTSHHAIYDNDFNKLVDYILSLNE